MIGWIKLHRSLLKWEWYRDNNVKILFLHFLLKANHETSRYLGHEIPPGSLVGGYPSLSEQTGLSIQSIRTAISKLKSTGEITVTITPKFSIISLQKWDEYQIINRQNNSTSTDDQQMTNRRPTTSKEVKKDRSKELDAVFEEFWKENLQHNRSGDSKKTAKLRFRTLMKSKLTMEEINRGVRSWVAMNNERPPEYRKGLSSWLSMENIEDALAVNVDVTRSTEPSIVQISELQKETAIQKHREKMRAKIG